MAAVNANAVAEVTAATNALTIATDKAAAVGVGAMHRGHAMMKREIYTPTPPASPEASNGQQKNGGYVGNGNTRGGIPLHPVPERSGNGTASVGDLYGGHTGTYDSVPSLT